MAALPSSAIGDGGSGDEDGCSDGVIGEQGEVHLEQDLLGQEEGKEHPPEQKLCRSLSIFDGMGITIGIMIGSGIFASPGEVVERAGGTREALLAWTASAMLVMMGALCYAELGAAFPHAGGDYWFLRLAYGEWAGFAFTWTNFFVLKTGSQAIILFVGSSYILGGSGAENDPGWVGTLLAVCSVWLLTAINCFGLRAGARVQNALTALKGVLLIMVFLMGIVQYLRAPSRSPASDNLGSVSLHHHHHHDDSRRGGATDSPAALNFMLGMVACLWAFDGWADVAFLGEELMAPERALPIVVVTSIVVVAGLFILVNISYMLVLTRGEIEDSDELALDFAKKIGGTSLGSIVAFGIGISALGSANGSILTGGRMFFAAARDGRFPKILNKLSRVQRAPYAALIAQGVVSTILLCLPNANFKTLLHYFAPASWLFYAATGSSVIALRYRYPEVPRPFLCPLYPLPPFLVLAIGLCLVVSCIASSPLYSSAALAFVAVSYPVYWFKFRNNNEHDSRGAAHVVVNASESSSEY